VLGSGDPPGAPEVSRSDGDTLGEPLPEAGAEGVAEGADVGAVGVGTGGWSHRHPGFGSTVRTGPACRGVGGTGAGRSAPAGNPAAGNPAGNPAAGRPGPGTAAAGDVARGRSPGTVDGPIPDFTLAAGGAGGNVAAAAGVSFRRGTNPFTTTRYAPAAPRTVSNPNADTRAARRGGRRGAGRRPATGISTGSEGRSHAWPPKVLMPVEVTSGPPAGGSDGRRPMS
jgi:hypothetical protein